MSTINALALTHIDHVITAGTWQDWLSLARECRGEYVRQRVLRATEMQSGAQFERWYRYAQTAQLGWHNTKAIRLLIASLLEKFNIHQVILFGSRARGDFRDYSDIDLAVVISGDTPSRNNDEALCALESNVFNELNCLCAYPELHLLHIEEWQGVRELFNPSILENIRKDGIILFSAPEPLP